jgi:hypothetical protein
MAIGDEWVGAGGRFGGAASQVPEDHDPQFAVLAGACEQYSSFVLVAANPLEVGIEKWQSIVGIAGVFEDG